MSTSLLKVLLLRMLAGLQEVDDTDFRPIERWIVETHLGAAMFELIGKNSQFEYLAAQEQFYANIFRSTVQQNAFSEIIKALSEKNIDLLLLKGASITPVAWDQPYLRYQADIDFMVRREAMAKVSDYMRSAGFQFSKPHRIGHYFDDLPVTNKEGQLEMFSADEQQVQIEVHSEVFLGHVQRLTTDRQEDDLWERRVMAEASHVLKASLWRLSNEDLLLHIIIHTAINHQFNKDVARNFIDLIRLAHRLPIDWDLLFEHIQKRKVVTATWLTLTLMQEIFDENPYTPLLNKLNLQAGSLKQIVLKKLIHREKILNLYIISRTRWRYALLLLMVDRVGDMLRLIIRLPTLEKTI